MSDIKDTRIRFTEEIANYIEDYRKRNNIAYKSHAVNSIIEEHQQMKGMTDSTNEIIDAVSHEISKEINKEIRRIRLGTNNTDRNTQILIELLNGFFLNPEVPDGLDVITTQDFESKAVQTAKRTVQNRIESLKQKKDDQNTRRGS